MARNYPLAATCSSKMTCTEKTGKNHAGRNELLADASAIHDSRKQLLQKRFRRASALSGECALLSKYPLLISTSIIPARIGARLNSNIDRLETCRTFDGAENTTDYLQSGRQVTTTVKRRSLKAELQLRQVGNLSYDEVERTPLTG